MRTIFCCLLILFASQSAFASDEISESAKFYQWLHGQKYYVDRVEWINNNEEEHVQQDHAALRGAVLRLNPRLQMDLPFFIKMCDDLLPLRNNQAVCDYIAHHMSKDFSCAWVSTSFKMVSFLKSLIETQDCLKHIKDLYDCSRKNVIAQHYFAKAICFGSDADEVGASLIATLGVESSKYAVVDDFVLWTSNFECMISSCEYLLFNIEFLKKSVNRLMLKYFLGKAINLELILYTDEKSLVLNDIRLFENCDSYTFVGLDVTEISDNFLIRQDLDFIKTLKFVGFYKLENIGDGFLMNRKDVQTIHFQDVPNLKSVGMNFLGGCDNLKELELYRFKRFKIQYLDFQCVKTEYPPVPNPKKRERVHSFPEKLKEKQSEVLRQPETLLARGLFATVGEMFIHIFVLIFHEAIEMISSLFELFED